MVDNNNPFEIPLDLEDDEENPQDAGLHDQPEDLSSNSVDRIQGGATSEELQYRELRIASAIDGDGVPVEAHPSDVGPGVRQLSLDAFTDPSVASAPEIRRLMHDKSITVMIGDEEDDPMGALIDGRGAQSSASVMPIADIATTPRSIRQPRSVVKPSPAKLRPDAGKVLNKHQHPKLPADPESAKIIAKESAKKYNPDPGLPNLEDLDEMSAEEFTQVPSAPKHPYVSPEKLTVEYLLHDNARLRAIIDDLSKRLGVNPSHHEPSLAKYEQDASAHEWNRLIQIVMGETVEGRRMHLVMVDGAKLSTSGFTASVDRANGTFGFHVTMEKDLFSPKQKNE